MSKTATFSAIIAHACAWLAFLFLALWPALYQGTTDFPVESAANPQFQRGQPPPEPPLGGQPSSDSLIGVNGFRVVPIILIPVLLSGIGLATILTSRVSLRIRKTALWVTTVLLLVFCVLGAWSIGILYLPGAIALLVAAIAASTQRAKPTIHTG